MGFTASVLKGKVKGSTMVWLQIPSKPEQDTSTFGSINTYLMRSFTLKCGRYESGKIENGMDGSACYVLWANSIANSFIPVFQGRKKTVCGNSLREFIIITVI